MKMTKSKARRASVIGAVAACAIGMALSQQAAHAVLITVPTDGEVTYGKYKLQNNQWGRSTGSGWMGVWTWDNTTAWSANWDWTGDANTVKVWPSMVMGWNWGTWTANSGLPTRIWDNKNVNTTYAYNLTGTNKLNVSYDLWFDTNPNLGNASPTDEVMIWGYRSGGPGPIGVNQGDVTVAGTTWELWKGKNGTSNVFSFVRKTNTNSMNLNLRDFTWFLVYDKKWMTNDKYLISVQAGTEVFTSVGTGQINVTSYSCNVL